MGITHATDRWHAADEHDDDVEPEVQEGDVIESTAYPLVGEEDDEPAGTPVERPEVDTDPDKPEI